MAAGLQLWDENGVLVFDTSTPLVKFLGTYSIGSSYGSPQSGAIYIPEWATYSNTPFFARSDGGYNLDGYDAVVWIEKPYIKWSYPRADMKFDQTFIYGML